MLTRSLFLFCFCVSLVLCDSTPCSATVINGLAVGHNVTYYGNTATAPKYQSSSSCNPGSAGTVWFTLTPLVNSIVTITTCGPNTNFDTFLGIYTGDCGSLYCVEGNDDTSCATVHASEIVYQASGEQIYIGLTGYSSNTGDYEITFSEKVGPVPSCTTAQPLVGPFFTPLAIVDSTAENGATSTISSCGLSTDTNQMWYTMQTSSANPLTITTCGPDTTFDTVISLLATNCTDFLCINSNDDNCTLSNESGASTLHFTPVPDFLYSLVVSGFDGASGVFNLDISQDQYTQDGCDSAFIVNLDRTQSIQGTTIGGSILPPAICDNEKGSSTWYSIYTPTGSQSITFSICNSYTNFDAAMSVYSNSCTEPTCIASTGCAYGSGLLTFSLNPNEYAYLVVASEDGSAGSYEIDITIA